MNKTPTPFSLRPTDLTPLPIPGLYVHVPFCFHKCHYCDFYSITRQSPQRMEKFVERILQEARMWTADSPHPIPRPRTVFIGGGTPSLLPLPNMLQLIVGLREIFDFSNLEEWTIEANPATVSPDYCRSLRKAGVDRLSFGAQSFNPSELQILERHHNPKDVPESIQMARDAGFERLNVDLIYAIPGQSLQSWSQTLESAIALQTNHLSCYGLTYESNTPIAVKKRLNLLQSVEESIELQMLHHTRQRLMAVGYHPYEISNYSTPGQECRHNLLYWHGEDYIGLGPSAASHVQGTRWKNRPHLGEWEQAIDAGHLPAADVETLSAEQRAGELAWLMLRMGKGLNFNDFAVRSGFDAKIVYSKTIQRLTDTGLLLADSQGVRLSETGINVADSIASEFISI
jgi:oxygen-independent coproporphyrinogen III oxidase